MAAHYRDDLLHGQDHLDPHASESRWRHQESTSFARHASPHPADVKNGNSQDLADLNNSRAEPSADPSTSRPSQPIAIAGNTQRGPRKDGVNVQNDNGISAGSPAAAGSAYNAFEVKCGPLLNYRRMENETWFGSVLIVTKGGGSNEGSIIPELRWRIVGSLRSPSDGLQQDAHGTDTGEINGTGAGLNNGVAPNDPENHLRTSNVKGTKLYSDPSNTFW